MRSAAQAIFRNDVITVSGKRRYIAVKLFRCRADSRGHSIAGSPPYNSLYEGDKTAILSCTADILATAATATAVAVVAANPRRR